MASDTKGSQELENFATAGEAWTDWNLSDLFFPTCPTGQMLDKTLMSIYPWCCQLVVRDTEVSQIQIKHICPLYKTTRGQFLETS